MSNCRADSAPYPLRPPLSSADFDPPRLQSFDAQVAGHPSTVFRTRGGQVVVKRSLLAEVLFYYQNFTQYPTLAPGRGLSEWTPRCHGAVTLSEADDVKNKAKSSLPDSVIQTAPLLPKLLDLSPPLFVDSDPSVIPANALVLENILHGFVSPNVLDIKLGTQHWDENSTPEKKERMIKSAQACTSANFGVRLTGWQTWDEARQQPFSVSKLFGKNILTQDELELGARLFFCSPRPTEDTDRYNEIVTGSEASSPHRIDSLPSLPAELVHRVVSQGLAPQLEEICQLVKHVEWRVRGGSVLLVFEGNQAALERKLNDPFSEPATYCKARLIDFAHATVVPGQGPDEGYVQGLQTSIALLRHVAAETAPASRPA
ncbi:unnamed protein product [Tilletia laevis]|uniref:Kinase n=2 Tax=Tilletia TaxID=13289 RepID=A0A177U9L2_9BASI|nr:hypothetical protein CF336_g5975 [Tilletia laevis]KAE8247567.1 hypothetical protein A4X03_0g7015 [Tilletia caries]KAE8193548.1 hypothetical protein CF335_g5561 [Tilletia laevis]CAD6888920.1 unnamed protein product [Tilletia caries]CAD6906292.1 unnamed protein product [Tilletia caries]